MSIILIKNLHHHHLQNGKCLLKNMRFPILTLKFCEKPSIPPDPPGFFSHHPPCPPWNRLQRSVWPKDLVVSHGVQRLRGHPLQHPLRLRSSDRERVKITQTSLGFMIDSYMCMYIYIYNYIIMYISINGGIQKC